ncbi:hypothetical protein [Mycobacterium hubeiense]|uniref:hypothetical protein n=1 Tax=Mycobacterium hubeiense TaxID=1867256 RepID=UPI000C7F10CC|nr:hypothetical protein [Mycobacterium sp. QGD 101]
MRAVWGVAAAITAGAVLAPVGEATAQPVTQGDAIQTIGLLEAEGYNVVIDRVGSGPLDQCIVTSVRNPQEVTRTFFVGEGKRRERVTVVVSKSITVSLNCDV